MQDLIFPDHEFLTVRELADLLRLKERKVYDLAASGAVPCSRATGKLLFPTSEVRQWIAQAQSGGPLGTGAPVSRPAVLLGSHDPLLDWAIRQSRCGLATLYDGSLDGLARFANGEGIAAGLHVQDEASGVWNIPAASRAAAGQNAVLIRFATRRRGLLFREGTAKPAGMADIAGLRLVPRQPESGTHVLFRTLARKAGLDVDGLTYTAIARTEDEAAEAVRLGEADVAFGLQAVAATFGLDYVHVVDEDFALLVDRKAWFDPPMTALRDFCATKLFRDRAAAYGGYTVSEVGKVLWNA